MITEATFLPGYMATVDGPTPLDILPMLAPEFRFSIIWNADGKAEEFAGGLDEFMGYMAQRNPDGHLHHLLMTMREGQVEVAFGRTTRHGEPLATFTFSVELDDQERILTLFAARTTTVTIGDLSGVLAGLRAGLRAGV
jgi:hypothetical protein